MVGGGRDLAERGRVAAPRQVTPGRFVFVTRRCALRQFFLRPDDATNQTVMDCLALAAQRTNMGVILPSVLSNHYTTMWDPEGRHPEFTEHFHKLTARAMNALRGRWENFWASEPPCGLNKAVLNIRRSFRLAVSLASCACFTP